MVTKARFRNFESMQRGDNFTRSSVLPQSLTSELGAAMKLLNENSVSAQNQVKIHHRSAIRKYLVSAPSMATKTLWALLSRAYTH